MPGSNSFGRMPGMNGQNQFGQNPYSQQNQNFGGILSALDSQQAYINSLNRPAPMAQPQAQMQTQMQPQTMPQVQQPMTQAPQAPGPRPMPNFMQNAPAAAQAHYLMQMAKSDPANANAYQQQLYGMREAPGFSYNVRNQLGRVMQGQNPFLRGNDSRGTN